MIGAISALAGAASIPVVNARHSQASPEWYTPVAYADAAREVFGGAITLDPASCEEANELIKAESFYTEGMDGLRLPWRGSVFINPPGGKNHDGPLVPQFWRKLVGEFVPFGGLGRVDQAIWIGYSIEQLQTLQNVKGYHSPLVLASAICFPRKRIAFVENAAMREQRVAKLVAAGKRASAKSTPSHASYVAYLGPNEREFKRVFARFGECR